MKEPIPMEAVFTKISGADDIWVRGMKAALGCCGGGRIEMRRHKGCTVFARDPEALRDLLRGFGLSEF